MSVWKSQFSTSTFTSITCSFSFYVNPFQREDSNHKRYWTKRFREMSSIVLLVATLLEMKSSFITCSITKFKFTSTCLLLSSSIARTRLAQCLEPGRFWAFEFVSCQIWSSFRTYRSHITTVVHSARAMFFPSWRSSERFDSVSCMTCARPHSHISRI